MENIDLGMTLLEIQLISRIEGYKEHIKALESSMDDICKQWDVDRRSLRELRN